MKIDWEYYGAECKGEAVTIRGNNNKILNNDFYIEETEEKQYPFGTIKGLSIYGSNNLVDRNNILMTGTLYLYGMSIYYHNNTVINNIIVVNSIRYASGIAINGRSSNNTLRNNTVIVTTQNETLDNSGLIDAAYAIVITEGAYRGGTYNIVDSQMAGNIIEENSIIGSSSHMYGIEQFGGTGTIIRNNEIDVEGYTPMAIGIIGADTQITNNLINVRGKTGEVGDSADYLKPQTTGIYLYLGKNTVISDNIITSDYGAAIKTNLETDTIIRDNILDVTNNGVTINVNGGRETTSIIGNQIGNIDSQIINGENLHLENNYEIGQKPEVTPGTNDNTPTQPEIYIPVGQDNTNPTTVTIPQENQNPTIPVNTQPDNPTVVVTPQENQNPTIPINTNKEETVKINNQEQDQKPSIPVTTENNIPVVTREDTPATSVTNPEDKQNVPIKIEEQKTGTVVKVEDKQVEPVHVQPDIKIDTSTIPEEQKYNNVTVKPENSNVVINNSVPINNTQDIPAQNSNITPENNIQTEITTDDNVQVINNNTDKTTTDNPEEIINDKSETDDSTTKTDNEEKQDEIKPEQKQEEQKPEVQETKTDNEEKQNNQQTTKPQPVPEEIPKINNTQVLEEYNSTLTPEKSRENITLVPAVVNQSNPPQEDNIQENMEMSNMNSSTQLVNDTSSSAGEMPAADTSSDSQEQPPAASPQPTPAPIVEPEIEQNDQQNDNQEQNNNQQSEVTPKTQSKQVQATNTVQSSNMEVYEINEKELEEKQIKDYSFATIIVLLVLLVSFAYGYASKIRS